MTVHQLSGTDVGTIAPNCVLVAVDLSRTSLRAADYAAGLARRTGVGVVGVYVRQNSAFVIASPGLAVYAHAAETDVAHEAGEYLAESALRLGTACAFTIQNGPPAEAIRRLARELRVSALVVGASEQPVHRLFGSLAAKLARSAPCPVIVVP
ncbi:MAG TPA: universal stress protein [Actinospica sp.]|jgi:nucleotide-binding universal stress UspA family protein|nr:universal stress protein [Actinospica sp.]